jgi:glutamyl-Q tRNA(Asp) synthetase
LDVSERRSRIGGGEPFALRLDVGRAVELTGPLTWHDLRAGTVAAKPELHGDVVLARKDVPTSYHLAVTVDDAAQEVNLVTRGEDLLSATHIHRLLQALLGLPSPRYYHHNLIADSNGLRLAKRNRAVTLRTLRHMGRTPDDIWRLVGLPEALPAAAAG